MKRTILSLAMALVFMHQAVAQEPEKKEPLFKRGAFADTAGYVDQAGYKTRFFPSLIVPAILIGYGLTTIGDGGIYSDRQARTDVRNAFKDFGSSIDDYLIFSPFVEFAALLAFKVKCKNDVINTALLIAKSEAIMLGIVFPLKYLTSRERPHSWAQRESIPLEIRQETKDNFHSFPSGHTAHAFLAATIVYREYRHKSAWIGAGAYALASSVALFRMINDQHWQSDVLVGAGIGILSANVVYATHIHRWGRKEVCLVPQFDGYSKGLTAVVRF